MKLTFFRFAPWVLAMALLASGARAQDLKSFEAKTTVHKLKNGWTFVIVERPLTPRSLASS